jgi:hypothetical protein
MNPAHAITGKRGAAFSLTEVVVALGVATVAIVSILALFPVGFDTVRESEGETQAAILARTVASDLAASVRATNRGFSNAVLVAGKDLTNSSSWVPNLNLSNTNTYWVAYKKEVQSGAGGMIGSPYCLRPSSFIGNSAPTGARTDGTDVVGGLAVVPRGALGSQVTFTVEYPASIPQTNRLRSVFTWMVAP